MSVQDDSGFLSRWSRRKVQSQVGKAEPPEPVPAPSALPEPAGTGVSQVVPAGPGAAGAPGLAPAAEPGAVHDETGPGALASAAQSDAPPPPTLAEADSLTPESDFTRFVRPNVDPQVKNLAMKKLFADPHFNVMDGLDTYIDDYNTPDPLPRSVLRQLVQARTLGLLDDELEAQPLPDATGLAAPPVANGAAQADRPPASGPAEVAATADGPDPLPDPSSEGAAASASAAAQEQPQSDEMQAAQGLGGPADAAVPAPTSPSPADPAVPAIRLVPPSAPTG